MEKAESEAQVWTIVQQAVSAVAPQVREESVERQRMREKLLASWQRPGGGSKVNANSNNCFDVARKHPAAAAGGKPRSSTRSTNNWKCVHFAEEHSKPWEATTHETLRSFSGHTIVCLLHTEFSPHPCDWLKEKSETRKIFKMAEPRPYLGNDEIHLILDSLQLDDTVEVVWRQRETREYNASALYTWVGTVVVRARQRVNAEDPDAPKVADIQWTAAPGDGDINYVGQSTRLPEQGIEYFFIKKLRKAARLRLQVVEAPQQQQQQQQNGQGQQLQHQDAQPQPQPQQQQPHPAKWEDGSSSNWRSQLGRRKCTFWWWRWRNKRAVQPTDTRPAEKWTHNIMYALLTNGKTMNGSLKAEFDSNIKCLKQLANVPESQQAVLTILERMGALHIRAATLEQSTAISSYEAKPKNRTLRGNSPGDCCKRQENTTKDTRFFRRRQGRPYNNVQPHGTQQQVPGPNQQPTACTEKHLPPMQWTFHWSVALPRCNVSSPTLKWSGMARVVPRVHNLILDKITPTPSTPSQSITKTPSTAVKTAVQKKLHSLIKHLKEKLEPATAYIRRLAAFAQKPIPMLTTQDILQWMIVLNNPQYSAEFGIRPAQARQQRRYLAAVRLNAIHRLDRDLAEETGADHNPGQNGGSHQKEPTRDETPANDGVDTVCQIQNLWPEHVTIQQQQANIQMKMSKSGKKNPFRIDQSTWRSPRWQS